MAVIEDGYEQHLAAREVAALRLTDDLIGLPGRLGPDQVAELKSHFTEAEIAELMACGCHMTYFITGRGSVVGSAISPVIKICANPETYARMADDMDVNAGRVLSGTPLAEVGEEIYDLTLAVASGKRTKSEELGHREFILTYKTFEPIGPACLPAA